MGHFDIPLDLPHAGRLSDRIVSLLERQAEARGVDAGPAVDVAEKISNLLFRFSANDENPPDAEALPIRDEAAALGRELVDSIVATGMTGDRLGQLVRNFFECLELGAEGAEISLMAGEDPKSLQRP
ncbi:MAG TPA: hypothetical protein VMS98_20375 [Thermoanaerobaculia bacterium]|nr:hypothetical protein [Thermoanaerobaculia bacterium]